MVCFKLVLSERLLNQIKQIKQFKGFLTTSLLNKFKKLSGVNDKKTFFGH
jgi:hypothetical protein